MRTTLISLILLALAVPAWAQGNRTTLEQQLAEKQKIEKTQTVLRDLTQAAYKAKVDMPTSDSLFVNDGKVSEAMYNAALRAGKVAIKTGETAKVTRVQVLDFAVQVFFGDESVALIGTTANQADTAKMSGAELCDLAKRTVAAFFNTVTL